MSTREVKSGFMQGIKIISVFLFTGMLISFAPPKKKKFIDPSNMDVSVKPGDNFYQYANGNWLVKNPVPSSKTRWGSFDVLRELSSKRLQTLLEEAAANAGTDTLNQKIGDYYASGMDSIALEKLGYQPIKPDLDKIAAIKDIDGVLEEISRQHTHQIAAPLFGFDVDQDRKRVTEYIPDINQGGTTLPDRDYYLSGDAKMSGIRTAYLAHIQKMFALIGTDAAAAKAKAESIMRIETALAKAQNSRTDMRDPYKTYNKYAVKDLDQLTPSISWEKVLAQHELKNVDSVVLDNPSFIKTTDILLSLISLDDWKTYLTWHELNNYAPFLSSAFVDENFEFGKQLTGQKEQTPRWQRMSNLIDGQLGELVGQLYVKKYFQPEAKRRMLDLVNNLQQTFGERIKALDWMSPETKTKALEKLNAFIKKIAYPDKWLTYSTVKVNRNDLIGNVHSSGRWAYQDMIGHYGKPVDKTLWGMTPPTINAYYNPANNEIVFPAGILQFPFFDFDADDAVIYGGIAAGIGHEMTHGFDDNGRQYAADGNLKDWWTADDASKFKTKADLVAKQYDAFTVQDSIHVNGKLTLGENIADLGGLAIAYEAFTHTKQFKEGKKIDGFTPAQRFFINWAQIWRANIRPQREAQLILVDTHSPGIYRTNGPIENMDAWYEAFDIKEGAKMYKAPDQRIKVW
jgi:putative endopeptidase